MSASNEVRFRIGADTSALQRGFIEAETRAAQLNKAFEKKLGAKDAFKGLVAGLGLGITEISTTIARALSGLSEETERSLTAIVTATERARQALDSQLKGRRTAGQNVEFNSEDQRRLQDELAGINARKPMRPEQRFISGMGMGVGTLLSNELEKNGFRSHRLEERAAEISAELAQLAQEKEAIQAAARDANRTRANVGASKDLAGRRAAGMPGTHEGAQYLELIRQETDLRAEAAEKTTSQARREQLVLQADQLVTRQLEMAAHWREANRATAERIEQIERETAAVGETKGEAIRRLKREALEADKKSRDLTRSEDERRGFRVQAAEKIAAAAKAEYDWKVGTANLEKSLTTKRGGHNTTGQGELANQASKFRGMAEQARSEGRFGSAKHFGDLARGYEEEFQKRDRLGMSGSGTLPIYGYQENAVPKSAWDKKYGDQLAARNAGLQATYGVWGKKPAGMEAAEARDRAYNDRFGKGDPNVFVRPKSFVDAMAAADARNKPKEAEGNKDAAAELKTAGIELKAAAAELKTALEPVELE